METLDLSTPSSMRVGAFARQAQISHLLDRLLTHLYQPTTDESFNAEEAKLLAQTLEAYIGLLPEEDPQPWPRYCGSLGICFRYCFWHFSNICPHKYLDNADSWPAVLSSRCTTRIPTCRLVSVCRIKSENQPCDLYLTFSPP